MSWTDKLLYKFTGKKKLKDEMIGAARRAEILTSQRVAPQNDRECSLRDCCVATLLAMTENKSQNGMIGAAQSVARIDTGPKSGDRHVVSLLTMANQGVSVSEHIEFAKELRSNKKEMSSLDFMPIKSSSDLRISLIKMEDPLTFSAKTRDDSLVLMEVCYA